MTRYTANHADTDAMTARLILPIFCALSWAAGSAFAQPASVPIHAMSSAASASAAKGHAKRMRRAPLATHERPEGATGGDPVTSARTPGGPPPGTPDGVTFPQKK